ncbi:MAG TPA: bifunctional diaminohydroxyphosphoribosylaminopyrimidine deaminase/5-amino-6-(5-phosphoribosylamino)uracil reductase RibD [Gemmatimonadales bacterium]|nr:bifunctional diaminohydroxyphosphoribosylaminopyrimidine deaminase/5-amino-6-(5-phosphoribosylamino)uracil reductase RibD [Gemmatimonadales bacterium]
MRRALELAERGWGRVHPNPLVGAIVVRGSEIVGEGWHAEFGDLHAETMALGEAGDDARGSTLVVTLEPCTHQGKQPPCVDAILRAGVARVLIAARDPDPVAQGGVARLRAAGVAVEIGMLDAEARRQNFRFLRRFAGSDRPFVTVKLAVSLDGHIADGHGNSRWVSGSEARAWVHWLRAGYGGIAVGGSTALHDDAHLTVRGAVTPRTAPARVVFFGQQPLAALPGILARDAGVPLMMVFTRAPEPSQQHALEAAGATVIVAAGLPEALHALAAAGVDALLVEGGGRLAGALLAAGLVDRVHQIQAPVWLGGGVPAWSGMPSTTITAAPRWRTVERLALGDDTMLTLEP